MRRWLLALIAAPLLSGCPGASEAHRGRCEVACTPPSAGPCATTSAPTCVEACLAQTEGLSAICVQCMVEKAKWDDCACSCYGTGCNLCCGTGACSGPAPGDTCQASQESCRGLKLGAATSPSECATFCIAAADGG